MNEQTFRAFSALAYDQAGIALSDEKRALVEARVGKRLRALSVKDESAYLEYLRGDTSGQELVRFLDVISTNYTSFFREPEHFDLLKEEAEAWRGQGRVPTVWCAAASSGEEPYTLAMTLEGVLGASGWRLLATDLSTKVLQEARAARYGPTAVQKVPPALLARHFQKEAGAYVVSPQLKRHVTFARLNLARPPYPMRGPFDAIFCRNVMIYFDAKVRGRLVREAERLLRPGGLFVVGHAESLSGLPTSLQVVRPSVYRAPGSR